MNEEFVFPRAGEGFDFEAFMKSNQEIYKNIEDKTSLEIINNSLDEISRLKNKFENDLNNSKRLKLPLKDIRIKASLNNFKSLTSAYFHFIYKTNKDIEKFKKFEKDLLEWAEQQTK